MNSTGFHLDKIKCPGCGKIQWGKVEHTAPWYTYIHRCVSCEYIIMESEWDKVTKEEEETK
jgi:hypothetical protein